MSIYYIIKVIVYIHYFILYIDKILVYNLIKNERIPVRIKRFLNIYNKESKDERCEYKYLVIFDDDSYSMIGTVCNE